MQVQDFFMYRYNIIEKQLKRENNLTDTDTSMSKITMGRCVCNKPERASEDMLS